MKHLTSMTELDLPYKRAVTRNHALVEVTANNLCDYSHPHRPSAVAAL